LFFSAAEVGGAGGPIVLGALYDITGDFDAGLWMLTALAVLLFLGALRLKSIDATESRA
jgi:cyanate permease